jgi:hypothetical protein
MLVTVTGVKLWMEKVVRFWLLHELAAVLAFALRYRAIADGIVALGVGI